MNNDIFWSEIGSEFVKPCGTPPPIIPRGTPWLSRHVRISNTVLDSGFYRAVDSGFQVLDSGFFVCEIGIPDSKVKDSGFHKQNFLEFRNPDYLRWGDFLLSHPILITVLRAFLLPETPPVYKEKTPGPWCEEDINCLNKLLERHVLGIKRKRCLWGSMQTISSRGVK